MLRPLLLLLSCAASLAAQTLSPATPLPPLRRALHTAPAGGPTGYGLWASGAAYKASFHDGFAFYPCIPQQRTTRGLHWHTESVRAGGQELGGDAPTIVHGAWRCELRHARFVEAYDVREDGVEQTFVFAERPAQAGDLVVTGRIDTPFRAAPRAATVGELVFDADEQAGAVVYGQASVFDAAGRRGDVTTAYDGERITLRVAAAFVAAATFPLTIDPLTTASTVITPANPIVDTAITADSTPGQHRLLLGYVRQFSATDLDVDAYVWIDTQVGAPLHVYTDIATYSTSTIDATEVVGTACWVLAVQKDVGATSSVFTYQIAQNNTTLNSGLTVTMPANTTVQLAPRIGGSFVTGNRALVTFWSNVVAPVAFAAVLDTQTHTFTAPIQLHEPGTAINDSEPSVVPAANGSEPWRVVWLGPMSAGNPAVAVKCAQIDGAGTFGAITNLAATAGTPHAPRIAGSASRYLATWFDVPAGTNGQLHALRFDVDLAGNQSNQHARVLFTAQGFPFFTSVTNGEVAHDLVTQSHWAVTYASTGLILPNPTTTAVTVLRLGYTGGVIESQSLHPVTNQGVAHPAVAFDGYPSVGSAQGFVTTHSAASPTSSAFLRRFTYTPPTVTFYGTSCRNNTMGDGHPPYAGSEFYRMGVVGLPPGTLAIAVLGFSATDIDLTAAGLTGCHLLVNQAGTLSSIADATGLAQATIALPDSPPFLGDVYLQWAWLEPAANAVGVVLGGGEQFTVN